MFGAQHLHHPLPGFGAVILRLQHASCHPLFYPPHRPPQLPSDYQAVIGLLRVLLGILSTSGGGVLFVSTQSLLHHHVVSACFPGVAPLLGT